MFPLQISSPKERGILQVSKWLKYQVLLDVVEMEALLKALTIDAPLCIAIVSEVVSEQSGLVESSEFLKAYTSYVQALKKGEIPDQKESKRYFSAVFTSSLDSLYAMQVGPSKYLIKPIAPIIQLQAHHFFYSTLDLKFHPMVLSQESVTWGLQFSYPQIFQDPLKGTIAKVGPECPNTALFEKLGRWMRNYTLPTPFVVNGKRTNSPIRLGKQCLSWIGRHPQLAKKEIGIFSI